MLGVQEGYLMSSIDKLGIWEVILRLAAATAIGCVIGINREMKGKPAGLRTHALVTLGAALITMMSIQQSISESVAGADALSRVIQGIITGIGFLGAGVIIRDEVGHVRGLTTAATIWVGASLGIACGAGYWIGVITTVSLVLIILIVGVPVERLLRRTLGRVKREHEEESDRLKDEADEIEQK
jgi:putative Mg2+ transporter-C (MgtC) family protein